MANDLRVLVYPNKEDKTTFFELDVFDSNGEAGNFPLTFQLVDIAEPKNRKSDFSKTVTFPGTARNNQFFTQLYEITVESTFDPRIRRYVSVLRDGQEILRGTIKLNNIKRENIDKISYECTLFGQLANIFQEMKITDITNGQQRDLLIADLFSGATSTGATVSVQEQFGFDDLTHLRDYDSIQKTWEGIYLSNGNPELNLIFSSPVAFADTYWNSSGDWAGRVGFTGATGHGLQVGDNVYIYGATGSPMQSANPQYQGNHTVVEVPNANSFVINERFSQSTNNEAGFSQLVTATGKGYTYPTINWKWQPNTDKVYYRDYKPATYAKEILDRLFKYTGFTYQSNFFDSQLFKRLCVPYTEEKIKYTEEQIEDLLFNVGVGATSTFSYTGTINNFKPAFTNTTPPYFDNTYNFDTVAYKWTVPGEGTFTFNANVFFNLAQQIVNTSVQGLPVFGETSGFFFLTSKFRISLNLVRNANDIQPLWSAETTLDQDPDLDAYSDAIPGTSLSGYFIGELPVDPGTGQVTSTFNLPLTNKVATLSTESLTFQGGETLYIRASFRWINENGTTSLPGGVVVYPSLIRGLS